jgi:hypothetical protein
MHLGLREAEGAGNDAGGGAGEASAWSAAFASLTELVGRLEGQVASAHRAAEMRETMWQVVSWHCCACVFVRVLEPG